MGQKLAWFGLALVLFATQGATGDSPASTSNTAGPKGGQGQPDQRPTQNTAAVTLDFLDSAPLVMSAAGGTLYKASVTLRNDSDADLIPGLDAILTGATNAQLSGQTVTASNAAVPRRSLQAVAIAVDIGALDLPVSGYLRLASARGSESLPAVHYRAVRFAASPTPTAYYPLGLSAGVAFAAIGVGAFMGRRRLSERLGGLSWNPADSWGTNVTVGGAVLNSLLGFSALPDQTHWLSRTTYTAVSTVLALLVLAAPAIYNLFRTPETIDDPPGVQMQGYVWAFVLSTAVGASGALGQLVLAGMILNELSRAHVVPELATDALTVLLAFVAVGLLYYGVHLVKGLDKTGTAVLKKTEVEEAVAQKRPAPHLPGIGDDHRTSTGSTVGGAAGVGARVCQPGTPCAVNR